MPKPFVVKRHRQSAEGQKIEYTPEQAAIEKLASDLFQLCGMNVPKTYLLEQNDASGVPHVVGLASKIIPNSKTLKSCFEGMTTEQRTSFYLNHEINGKPIAGLYQYLATFAFICDYDGIGAYYSNLLVVEEPLCNRIYKIDPGEARITNYFTNEITMEDVYEQTEDLSSWSGFDADLEKGVILKLFYHNPKWRYNDIFGAQTWQQHQDNLYGIAKICRLTDKALKKTIFNPAIPELALSNKKRKEILNSLIMRRDNFRVFYQQQLSALDINHQQCYQPIPTQRRTVLSLDQDFVDTGRHMPNGFSQPAIYNKKPSLFKNRSKTNHSALDSLKALVNQAKLDYEAHHLHKNFVVRLFGLHGHAGINRARKLEGAISREQSTMAFLILLKQHLNREEGFLCKHQGRLNTTSFDTILLSLLCKSDLVEHLNIQIYSDYEHNIQSRKAVRSRVLQL